MLYKESIRHNNPDNICIICRSRIWPWFGHKTRLRSISCKPGKFSSWSYFLMRCVAILRKLLIYAKQISLIKDTINCTWCFWWDRGNVRYSVFFKQTELKKTHLIKSIWFCHKIILKNNTPLPLYNLQVLKWDVDKMMRQRQRRTSNIYFIFKTLFFKILIVSVLLISVPRYR